MRWYFRPWAIIAAIFVAGPFAAPLVWKSPAIKKPIKLLVLLGLGIMTIYLIFATVQLADLIRKHFEVFEKALY